MEGNVFLNRIYTNQQRGLAMLLIVLCHVSGMFGEQHFFLVDNRYFTPLGGIGSAMFLLLSGYGLTESYKSKGLQGFCKKKIVRLLIPWLLSIPLFYVVAFVSPIMNDSSMSKMPHHWYFEFLWFVQYLVIWYMVFYFSRLLFKQYALPAMVVCGIISFFTLDSTLMTAQTFSFVAGVAVSEYKDYLVKNNTIRNTMLFSIILLVFGMVALAVKQLPQIRLFDLTSYVYRSVELCIYLPLGGALIAFGTLCRIKDYGILIFVGQISYELYLVHVPFLYGLNNNYLNVLFFLFQCTLHAYILHKICGICVQWIDRHIFVHA